MPDLYSKDAMIQLHGKLLIEWSEMGALRRSQVEKTKAFITSRVDTFRPPFERAAIDVPRTCCFAGTSNDDDFLEDATGGRRFWLVKCEQVDLDWIDANRVLLWRLAVQAEAQREEGWITATDQQRELEELQADAQRRDPWEERVLHLAAARGSNGININSDFIFQAVSVPTADQHNGHTQRVASILKRAGWYHQQRRDGPSRRQRLWFPAEKAH